MCFSVEMVEVIGIEPMSRASSNSLHPMLTCTSKSDNGNGADEFDAVQKVAELGFAPKFRAYETLV